MSQFTSNKRQRALMQLAVVASFLGLSGCVSDKGIAPTAQRIEHLELQSAGKMIGRDAWPADNWWQAYGDAQLNALVERALNKNPTLAVAKTRILRAQAASELTRSADGVQVNAGLDASYGRQSANYIIPKPPFGIGGTYVSQGQGAVDFSFDLDLWGKNAALIRASTAQTNAAQYDLDAARLAISTALVRSYVQLAAQYETQDLLLAIEKQRNGIRTMAQQRLNSGLDTAVEVRQSETSVAALRLDLVQLETAQQLTRLQINALTGAMPSTAASITRPSLTAVPMTVPHNLPLDLLGRRPELAAQRARIDAALGDAAAAKAQFYPNISLNGFAGLQSIGLDKLLSTGSFINSIGPAIHLPIFDNGRLRANYRIKTADVDAAVSLYNQSVLGAVQDVAEQLTRLEALAREEAASKEALTSAQEAYRLAMLRYRGKLSTYLSVLTVETQVLAQQRVALDLKAKRQDLQIALVRALGGGFIDPATASASNEPK